MSSTTNDSVSSPAIQVPEAGRQLLRKLLAESPRPDGVPSTTIPPRADSILPDLNDLVPLVHAAGECQTLADLLKPYFETGSRGLPRINGRVITWRIDEYLGGLCALERCRPAPWIKRAREAAWTELQERATRPESPVLTMGFEDDARDAWPAVSPWSMGLAEVLLTEQALNSEALAKRMLTWWTQDPVFKRWGVFPTRTRPKGSIWNWIWLHGPGELLPKLNELANTQFYYLSGRYRILGRLLPQLPIGPHFQCMKPNTNLLFSLLEWAAQKKEEVPTKALDHFIARLPETFLRNGYIHQRWSPRRGPQEPHLSAQFALIDLLCDLYYRVSRRPEHLALAETLAQNWWQHRWANGFVPSTLNDSEAHLDDQTDFSISLWRLWELTENPEYKAWSQSLFDAVTARARSKNFAGYYCERVRRDGPAVERGYVSVKYNALLLKGFIRQSNPGISSFSNPAFHELMKDR
jgi:hypothetical protein